MGNQIRRNARAGGHSSRRKEWSEDSLKYYMKEIERYPVLEADAEAALARAWRDHDDPKAADRLVGSHQRLVVKIAREYRGYGLPLCDLISEGNVGLMLAIDKFDPDRGVRLTTYAMYWVRRAMTRYILRSFSSVKRVTTEQDKRVFFKLRGLVEKHRGTYDIDLSPEALVAIAAELSITESEVTRLNHRVGCEELSINAKVRLNDDKDSVEWQDLLVDPTIDLETDVIEADELKKRRALLRQSLDVLDERERQILSERMLKDEPTQLSTLGDMYGLSRERVRQIEARAFEKLRKRMHNSAMGAHPPARIGRPGNTATRGHGLRRRPERIDRKAS
jgi:RNA polymerase sigma-32 factor